MEVEFDERLTESGETVPVTVSTRFFVVECWALSVTVTPTVKFPGEVGLHESWFESWELHPGGNPVKMNEYGAVPPETTTVMVVVEPSATGLGVAAKEDIVGAPATELTVREVEPWAVSPFESVTTTVTENDPDEVGVHDSEAVFEEAHPGGRPE